jgi:hypothetical protein
MSFISNIPTWFLVFEHTLHFQGGELAVEDNDLRSNEKGTHSAGDPSQGLVKLGSNLLA